MATPFLWKLSSQKLGFFLRWPRRTRASWTGPYVGTMTAYDLKKTLAVLLDNIMLRLGKLEVQGGKHLQQHGEQPDHRHRHRHH
ncbi:hypothetical protein KUCAC02_032261, partial [Chaenocephalus aceratus]